MANEQHLKILRQGVVVWNQWRKENPNIQPDLSGADLIGADLNQADLGRVNLSAANLTEADLSGANLTEADLSGAYLLRVDLSTANLTEADLSGAYLIRAYLNWTHLAEVNLLKATMGFSTFGYVNLSAVKGLDTVRHFAPSSISIQAIYRSKGNIPDVFLRGAGVPDTFITQISSLVEKVIQYYSCFISHSSKDKDFCDRLYTDLKGAEVPVFYFPEDAKWGETVWGEIDRSIITYDKLVAVCSENSLQSGPVLREIERALQREDREGKNVLLPVRLDDYIFDHWEHPRKADVVSKVVGDFQGWDRSADKYDDAFKRLLKWLEAEG